MRVDTLYFVPDLEEMLSTFHIEYDVSCRFVIYEVYYIEAGYHYAHFMESYHKWVLNFVKTFFCIEMIMWFLFFSSLI